MSHYLLSKTSFLRGLQCPRALFFYRYYPQLKDPLSPEKQALLSRGNEVGILARKLFPGGTDATAGSGPRSMDAVVRTKELIGEGAKVIYEAGFVFNEILVLADVLVKTETGWEMYEVKSSLRSTPTHVTDAALQYAVVRGAGLNVEKLSLIHLNGSYVRGAELDVNSLFVFRDITREANGMESELLRKAEDQKLILGMPQAPEVEIGERCFTPYECDFRGQCWKHVKKDNPFTLSGVSRGEQARLFSLGFSEYKDIPNDVSAGLPRMTRLQITTAHTGRSHIDKEKLSGFLAQIGEDVLFADMEGYQPAIPRYEGTSPFTHLPFGFSLHHYRNGGIHEHEVYVAEPGSDPSREFLVAFLRASEGEQPILIYDVSAERTILGRLKNKFPEFERQIEQRLSRTVDLMKPFAEGWYHHPDMMGSFSLKNVLPALVPDLHYKDLKIRNGNHAMSVYEGLEKDNDLFSRAEKLEALKEYSILDTLGMVRIWEVLRESVR